ncbi:MULTISPECIES: helix-turn-helix domain-containing protein [unclassified Caulobacter]|uniref:helix-turn-helix domain-containing protein n=1 Tax=unclassified Caulobacter TaxID=2648921 RepID=UPI000D38A86C|nr:MULTISPECIES: helix-turn-helix domain-containing protein [unclassified Caulobacter]PTS90890.1 chromosomal replication initiator DnaA [Caulobacter sp. HMWF009]PTT12369.1 chromosomal replication initiator DnaA [Caulobacter sp. HMWF025]
MLVQALEDLWAISPDPRRDRLTVAFVTHLVALATDVSPSDIAAHKRVSSAAARARQIAIYLTHITFHWPLARVAFAFGRDRTTCAHACHRVEDLRENPDFDARLGALEDCLRQAPRKSEEPLL